MPPEKSANPAFVFDMDGTLADSVYQHVVAWQEAFAGVGINMAAWRIHRRIGMSGSQLIAALSRDTGRPIDAEQKKNLQHLHGTAYARRVSEVRPFPAARELLTHLSRAQVPWVIATSGKPKDVQPLLDMLQLGPDTPIVTGDEVAAAKPEPDILHKAAGRLGVDVTDSIMIGDSVWDLLAARRAKTLGVGLLCGGFSRDELETAGAYRVYDDPADLLAHLDEVGLPSDH